MLNFFTIGLLGKPCILHSVHRQDEVMNSQSLMPICPTGRARSKQSKGRSMPMKTTNKRSLRRRLKLQGKHASVGVVAEVLQIARVYVCVPTHSLLSFVHRCRITASPELIGMTSDKDTPKSLTDTYHDRETTLRK